MEVTNYLGRPTLIHKDHDDILEIEPHDDPPCLEFETDNILIFKEDVKSLINYLQNWVNTGDFEGTKEAESND